MTRSRIVARNTTPEDFDAIIGICGRVYPSSPPWTREQLAAHLRIFPEGQFVAVDTASGAVVGMCASLIILWADYDLTDHWRDFTDRGMFTNHDPKGRTLYGAEVLVEPARQRTGAGSALYAARRELTRRLGLLRIRSAARLRHYHRYAARMTPPEYVRRVVRGELRDPTLSFQLKHGFRVLAVVGGYLAHDPESLGWAAVIEWLNPEQARPEDAAGRDPRFAPPEPDEARSGALRIRPDAGVPSSPPGRSRPADRTRSRGSG
jgi:GNAT superfamily N-acetyltransferase